MLSPSVYRYLVETSVREPDVLRRLGERTAQHELTAQIAAYEALLADVEILSGGVENVGDFD